MKKEGLSFLLSCFFLLVLSSCATPAKFTSMWRDESLVGRKYWNVLIIGVSDKSTTKEYFEDKFAEALRRTGIQAVASYQLISSEKVQNREVLLEKARNTGIDAVLVVRLVRKEYGEFRPGETENWDSFYSRSFGYTRDLSSPGAASFIAVVDSRLFDVRLAKPVWAASADVKVQGDVVSAISRYVEDLAHVLEHEQFFQP